VFASWEDLRKACAPALADLARTRPGVLRLGPAPDGVPAVDPWGHDVSSLWLWDTDGGSGTGIWLGEPDEDPSWALLRATEVIQSAAIEAVHGAWPECPEHPHSHPLEPGGDEVAVWIRPVNDRSVARVGELPADASRPTA
jgi:hypothetical protein